MLHMGQNMLINFSSRSFYWEKISNLPLFSSFVSIISHEMFCIFVILTKDTSSSTTITDDLLFCLQESFNTLLSICDRCRRVLLMLGLHSILFKVSALLLISLSLSLMTIILFCKGESTFKEIDAFCFFNLGDWRLLPLFITLSLLSINLLRLVLQHELYSLI